jgi:monofunctional glycosyltransferase
MFNPTAIGRRVRAGRWPRWLRFLAFALVLLMAGTVLLIVLYRFVNPPVTTTMLANRLTGTKLQQRWVPIENISRHLPLAVIVSEDGRFCDHRGVDWGAVREAIAEAEDARSARGASTIPMQTAKNLFLWNSRSYLRKALEVPLAYTMTLVWPKRRMMEVYLNIAEFGPGIFGAEAASRHHFKKSAADLSAREAALLAAALPAPHRRIAGKPGPLTQRIARVIERRMAAAQGRAACISG